LNDTPVLTKGGEAKNLTLNPPLAKVGEVKKNLWRIPRSCKAMRGQKILLYPPLPCKNKGEGRVRVSLLRFRTF